MKDGGAADGREGTGREAPRRAPGGPRGEADAPATPSAAKPPPRVRVTASRVSALGEPSATNRSGLADARRATGATGATGRSDASDPTDVHAVYVRSLIRSQLRLALVCAIGFVAATALFVVAIAWAPALDATFVAGVPVSWLLLAVGVYPLALTIAAVYVRAATRNEAQYRSLAEDS